MPQGLDGFFHSVDFETALAYTHPATIDGFDVRIVLRFICYCSNGGTTKKGRYTRRSCLRYKLIGVAIVPETVLPLGFHFWMFD